MRTTCLYSDPTLMCCLALWAGIYSFQWSFQSTTKVFEIMWQFSVSYIIISSNPNSVPQHFAGWMCLCKAHILWMKRFVFLITASHPFPLYDIQINTLPLAFVLFILLFSVSWGFLFLSVVLISLGSSSSSSCPCFLFSFPPFPSALFLSLIFSSFSFSILATV